MARLITESRGVNGRRGSLAVVRTDQFLLKLGRHHLDDLETMAVGLFAYRTPKKVNSPGVSHHASVSELGGGTVAWWSR